MHGDFVEDTTICMVMNQPKEKDLVLQVNPGKEREVEKFKVSVQEKSSLKIF
jgi:hypothetical protein